MRGFRHWRWHLDEVYVKINGEMHYLWRAVDHEGEGLESYITKSRDKKAALTFMMKVLKHQGAPEMITTDGLRSYEAAMREVCGRYNSQLTAGTGIVAIRSKEAYGRSELRNNSCKTIRRFEIFLSHRRWLPRPRHRWHGA
jgi:putative transposase